MSWNEPKQSMVIDGKVKFKAPEHRLAHSPKHTPHLSREELGNFLRSSDTDINRETIKNIQFDFFNPYNLIFTVHYTKASGGLGYKDFPNPTSAFLFWLKTPLRKNSAPFISVRPPKSDSFPYNFKSDGYLFQIALRYIEYLDKIDDWVKFLEESHREDLK